MRKFKRQTGLGLAASALTACGGAEGQRSSDGASTLEDIDAVPIAPDANAPEAGADLGGEENNLPAIHTPAPQAPEITSYAAKLYTARENVTYSRPSIISPPEVNQACSESYLSEPKDLARFVNLSGDPLVDALLVGSPTFPGKTDYIWTGEGDSKTISFSFVDPDLLMLDEADYNFSWDSGDQATNYVYNNEILGFSDAQMQNIRKVFAEFEEVIDVNFVEVTEGSGQVGTIRLGLSGGQFEDYAAFAVGPGRYWSSSGDIWFFRDAEGDDFEPGSSWYYGALIHELGHAMGLKHPHEISNDNAAKMPDKLDEANYTLLSYNEPDWGWAQSGGDEIWTISNSLQVYDIAALQYLYGANSAYNLENTVYAFDAAVPFTRTIWDAGGVDMLDFSQLTLGSTVILEPGSYSTVPFPDWTPVDNLGIAFGTIIENVIGTSGDDVIHGNDAPNHLSGHSGNDIIHGGGGDDVLEPRNQSRAGDDTLMGGAGDDVYFLSEGDTCVEFEGKGFDTIVLVDISEFTLPDNFECVIGSDTQSSVTGNSGDNIFLGGAGDDVFTGMGGADTFLITSSMGHDTFLDFSELEGDKIQFAESSSEFSYSESELGFVIFLDVGNSLTVTYA